MKPEYVNTFALRKVVNKEGEALEITLDASHKYMENNVTVTSNGLENGRLPLTPSSFGLDTMILDCPPLATAQLVDDWGHPRVTVKFAGFDYLGLWTAPKPFDTGYVCIEPWTSLPDASFVGRELSQKAGVRCLAPGQREVLTYTTTINHRSKEELE